MTKQRDETDEPVPADASDLDAPPVLPSLDEPRADDAPLAPAVAPRRLTALDLLDAAAAAEAEPAPQQTPGFLGLGLRDITAETLGLPGVVGPEDDPDAPRLPLSAGEPPAVSSIDPRLSKPDPAAMAVLERYTQRASTQARIRDSILAALAGQPYDPGALPDTRTMLLGICRVLVQSGVPAEALADAIAEALGE